MKKIVLLLLLVNYLHAGNLDKDKSWGTEVNFLIVPSVIASYFNHEHNYEIAMQMAYISQDNSSHLVEGFTTKTFSTDILYRHYFSENISGVYGGIFSRLTFIDGKLSNDYRAAKVTKLGLGLEVGYRKFFSLFNNNSFYWGTGLKLGGYVLGENDIFDNKYIMPDDLPIILSLEFLKFGYAF